MPDGATVGELRQLLEATLKVPYADQTLSLDQGLVRRAAATAASAQLALLYLHTTPTRRRGRAARRRCYASAR